MASGSALERARAFAGEIAITPLLALGAAAIAIPTLINVAQQSWSTEQGAHGPIVLVTGLWLISRDWAGARALVRPGSPVLTAALLAILLPLYVFARVTDIIEIEGATMYALLLVAAYAVWGGAALRRLWFPLFYLLFIFPPPDTLFAMLTQPLKIAISQAAVAVLHALGYPVAGSGVTIQIGPYEMLVAAACAGLNSLISLTALGLFYTYLRHSANLRFMLLLVVFILPIAAFANLLRVLILLLITFYFGEAAGQGFLHEVAGLLMFLIALGCIFMLEGVGQPLRRRLAARPSEAELAA